MPSPALINPLLVNALPNTLAANLPNNTGRNPLFCYFVLFLIVSLTHFTSNLDSSCDVTIFIISTISSIGIFNAVVWEAKRKRRHYPFF